ncbi:MAG TPA: hypothetical protein VJX67_21310 [Blastocatellia bacterium]|nr:hypothetical protein [Blastocatellia bacterium]
MPSKSKWARDHQLWVEAFALFNFLALTLDIYLAHSTNNFRRPAEYIPLYFSLAAPVLLLIGLIARERWSYLPAWRDLGYFVGWSAVGVGLVGLILHLDSAFFYQRTIKSLTYAAPFAAPLAYAGLGLVLIMNRMVDPESIDWAKWLLLLSLGGFIGNLVFSLTDHATNGFFRPIEWLPVISSSFAVSFLLAPFLLSVSRKFLLLCATVLVFQALAGILGFLLHGMADLRGPGRSVFENVVNGAPLLAPLLFPNLVVLSLIAIWELAKHLPEREKAQTAQ